MNKGFTFVELVIVIAIIVILIGMTVVKSRAYINHKRATATINELLELEKSLQTYHAIHKDFPNSEETLQAELKGIQSINRDNPFKRKYSYQYIDNNRVIISTEIPHGLIDTLSGHYFKIIDGEPYDKIVLSVIPNENEIDLQNEEEKKELYLE